MSDKRQVTKRLLKTKLPVAEQKMAWILFQLVGAESALAFIDHVAGLR